MAASHARMFTRTADRRFADPDARIALEGARAHAYARGTIGCRALVSTRLLANRTVQRHRTARRFAYQPDRNPGSTLPGCRYRLRSRGFCAVDDRMRARHALGRHILAAFAARRQFVRFTAPGANRVCTGRPRRNLTFPAPASIRTTPRSILRPRFPESEVPLAFSRCKRSRIVRGRVRDTSDAGSRLWLSPSLPTVRASRARSATRPSPA